MKRVLLDMANTIICCRKAPTPLNQIQQIVEMFQKSEFTDFETLQVVTQLNDLCNRLVAPFQPAKIVQFIKIEDNQTKNGPIRETDLRIDFTMLYLYIV